MARDTGFHLSRYFHFRAEWGSRLKDIVSEPLFLIAGSLFTLAGLILFLDLVSALGLKTSWQSGFLSHILCVPLLTVGILILAIEWLGNALRNHDLRLLTVSLDGLTLGVVLTASGLILLRL
jgi:hypothetical protein